MDEARALRRLAFEFLLVQSLRTERRVENVEVSQCHEQHLGKLL